jgi:osmotically-inducible protein OsmY
MTGVPQSVGWTELTRARAAALVVVLALVSPARPIRPTDAATFPLVAQAQTTPQAGPAPQTEAGPQADLDRQPAEAARQAEQDAAAERRAEQQIRRLYDTIFRQADEEAAARKAERRRGETIRQPDAARSRPQEVEPVRRPAEPGPVGAPVLPTSPIAPPPVARPAEPAMAAPRLPGLSAQELARIQSQAEQRLRSRGLFRESSADRWGVALDVGPLGNVTLSGLLRDTALYDEAVRLVREVPGVQGVTGDVRVAENRAPGESVGAREQIQQKLRGRGLLRESGADRWGVTVEVSAEGDIKLAGALRDAGLRREAIRLAQEIAGVRPVTDEISVMEGPDRR